MAGADNHMKQILSLIIFALSAFFAVPIFAAGNGACSWHDGVDCSAGSDYDGSVICNDGWRDSSVEYSDVQECKKSCIRVSPDAYIKLIIDSECSGLEYIRLLNQRDALINARFNNKLNPSMEESTVLTQEQKNAIQNKDLDSIDRLLMSIKSQLEFKDICERDRMRLISMFCPDSSKRTPTCGDGYVVKNNQCLTYTQDCQQAFGNYSYGIKGTNNNSSCYCTNGYQWNNSRTACVLSPAPSPKQCLGGSFLNVSGSCVCLDGYFWDSGLNICSKIIVEPPLASKPTTFVGIPKTKTDLFNCSVVGKKQTSLYYLRDSKTIKQMTPVGKVCFATEQEAKDKKFKKAKWQ